MFLAGCPRTQFLGAARETAAAFCRGVAFAEHRTHSYAPAGSPALPVVSRPRQEGAEAPARPGTRLQGWPRGQEPCPALPVTHSARAPSSRVSPACPRGLRVAPVCFLGTDPVGFKGFFSLLLATETNERKTDGNAHTAPGRRSLAAWRSLLGTGSWLHPASTPLRMWSRPYAGPGRSHSPPLPAQDPQASPSHLEVHPPPWGRFMPAAGQGGGRLQKPSFWGTWDEI